MDRNFAATAALCAFCCARAGAQVTFTPFPVGALVESMSADGSVIVGNWDSGTVNTAFRWTQATGIQQIGVPGMFGDVYISRDGNTIVGTVPDSKGCATAAVWKGGTNWMLLPSFPGVVPSEQSTCTQAEGVSADGSVIVGDAYVSTSKKVAFRWDAQNGMVNLGTFDEDPNSDSAVYAVSADGRTVIGWDYKPGFSPPGIAGGAMNGRRGAIWWDGKERMLHAFGWAGEAWATNDVGSIIVGQFHPMDQYNRLYTGQGASTYMYTAWNGYFADLGAVPVPPGADPKNYISQPFGVSDDGSVVVGESGWIQKIAMIWMPATGMISMKDFLTQKGVANVQDWYLLQSQGVTPDGRLVFGYGQQGTNPSIISWIVTLR